MRRPGATTLLVLLAALLVIWSVLGLNSRLQPGAASQAHAPTPVASPSEKPPASPGSNVQTKTLSPAWPEAATANSTPAAAAANVGAPRPGLEFTNLPPEIVLDNMRNAIRHYCSMMGGNPVGTNPEITGALNGKNPKQASFLDPEAGLRINPNGELVDPWGTPYFFHQLSGTEMEIHSAGPDKILWTPDDLVVK